MGGRACSDVCASCEYSSSRWVSSLIRWSAACMGGVGQDKIMSRLADPLVRRLRGAKARSRLCCERVDECALRVHGGAQPRKVSRRVGGGRAEGWWAHGRRLTSTAFAATQRAGGRRGEGRRGSRGMRGRADPSWAAAHAARLTCCVARRSRNPSSSIPLSSTTSSCSRCCALPPLVTCAGRGGRELLCTGGRHQRRATRELCRGLARGGAGRARASCVTAVRSSAIASKRCEQRRWWAGEARSGARSEQRGTR